jgi:hypothetical protein
LLAFPLLAQVSEGGSPASFSWNTAAKVSFQQLEPPASLSPDVTPTGEEPQPYRIAAGIPVDLDLARDGSWAVMPDGSRVLRLGIAAEGALALIFYYSHFSLPEGGRLFIYSSDRTRLIGAFTSRNNPSGGYFATEAVAGEAVVMEYDPPRHESGLPDVRIYQVHYVYRGLELLGKGPSGPCEVNVNCPEGNSWQNEKRSVAKIVLKAGSGTYLCTGALVNNVRQDSTPYLLTARHCGNTASLSDYSQWVFHFNYESLDCEEPLSLIHI